MPGETRERILETALELFAQRGYLATSTSEIADRLGMTKAALYKHYPCKQAILDRIVERMREMDDAGAKTYEMPEQLPECAPEAYRQVPADRIRAFSMAQFRYWTQQPFAANFRKMLTLEQYRQPQFAALYQNYLASGPVGYMAAVFADMAESEEDAMQLALEFYGPMFLLYSVYDSAEDKTQPAALLSAHIDRFFARM